MDANTTLTELKRELSMLATLRDQLRLKAHLAHAELRTDLDDLERRLLLVEEELQRSKHHLAQDEALIARKVAVLLKDLRLGYENAKRAFYTDA